MVRERITTVRRAATWDDTPDLFLKELADWSEDEDPFPYVLLIGPDRAAASRRAGGRAAGGDRQMLAFDGRRLLWCREVADGLSSAEHDAGAIVAIEHGTGGPFSWLRLRLSHGIGPITIQFAEVDSDPVLDLLRDLRVLLSGKDPVVEESLRAAPPAGGGDHLRFLAEFRRINGDSTGPDSWLYEPSLIGRSFGVFPKLVEPAHALFVTCGEIIALSDWPVDGSSEDSALLRTFVPRRFLTVAAIELFRAGRSERCLLKLSVEGHEVLQLGFSRAHEAELRLLAVDLTSPSTPAGCGE